MIFLKPFDAKKCYVSQSCTYFRLLVNCETTLLQNSPPQLAMSKYYASDSRDNIVVAVDVATTSFCAHSCLKIMQKSAVLKSYTTFFKS